MIKRILFVFALAGFVLPARSQKPARRTQVAEIQKIAKWKIEEVVRSYSANNDTVYVVNFWATFCKPCNEEIPDFIRIVEKFKTKKVKLLLVSLDLPAYVPVKLPAFIKKNKYNTNHAWLNETDADRFCPMIDEKWSGAIPATIIVNNKTGYRKFIGDQVSAAAFEQLLNEATGGNAGFKYTAPMNNATVKDNKATNPDAAIQDFVSFASADSSVYAVSGGKVSMVAKIDHMKVVIIEKEAVFYTYSNLGSTTLKKGDAVRQDQFIGYAAYDLDGNKPTIEFYVSDAEKNRLLTKANFVSRKDNKAVDHSFDPVPEPK